MRFLTFFGFFARFRAILSLFLQKDWINSLCFLVKLFHPKTFRLGLVRVFLLRGSLRISFYMNSIHQVMQCNFRLQQLFTNIVSSDFAHKLNLSFPEDGTYNGENHLPLFCFIFEKKEANIGDFLQNGSNFEQRERKCANTCKPFTHTIEM